MRPPGWKLDGRRGCARRRARRARAHRGPRAPAPRVSGDPEPDDEDYIAATDGLAEAIDAAWTAGELEACNRLEVRLWLDGPAGPEGRVSGPPRELALDMNHLSQPARPSAPALP